jgi:hypothetical protein
MIDATTSNDVLENGMLAYLKSQLFHPDEGT